MTKVGSGKSIGRGGFRPGAGRPRLAPLMPVEHLFYVMRNPKAEPAMRLQAAMALLPLYPARVAEDDTDAAVPIGKKAAERLAADNPDAATPMGALLARRAARS